MTFRAFRFLVGNANICSNARVAMSVAIRNQRLHDVYLTLIHIHASIGNRLNSCVEII